MQPLRFFLAVRERLGATTWDSSHRRARGEPVAAALFLVFNGVLVYKWGASDATAWRQRPNNRCSPRRSASGWSGLHGRWTGAGPSSAQHGLRAFKAGFGAQEHELRWSFAARRVAAVGARGGDAGAVIRRSPPLVCRAIGASLYRFAA